jgi:hypothetical protein
VRRAMTEPRPVIGVGRAQRPIRVALVSRSGAAAFESAAQGRAQS